MNNQEKNMRLEATVDSLCLRFGTSAVVQLGAIRQEIAHVSSGFRTLDSALGIGGFPLGQMSHIAGVPTSGATTIALKTLAQAQASFNAHSLEPVLQNLVRLYVIQGQLEKGLATAENLLHSTGQMMYRSGAHLELSKLNYERNDLQAASHHARKGWGKVNEDALIQRTELRLAIEGYVIQARLRHMQGAEADARNFMQQAVQLVQKHDLRQTFLPTLAWQAWLWLVQDDVEAAEKWAEKIEPTTYGDLNPSIEFEHIILARFYIALGRVDDAQELLTRLRFAASNAGRMGRVISLSILQALSAKMQGNIRAALDALSNSLTLAEPEGYVRTFVDEGVRMRELLSEAQARGISTVYVTKLLSAFTLETPTISATPQERLLDGDGEFEPLSERELEVLHLIADGLSNRKIAQRLVVSVGTVKKHLNNIFIKLAAHSRTQVIATAGKYNLLRHEEVGFQVSRLPTSPVSRCIPSIYTLDVPGTMVKSGNLRKELPDVSEQVDCSQREYIRCGFTETKIHQCPIRSFQ